MKTFFISSTFKDMQAERDILHSVVFPKMRRRLVNYAEDVQEMDLRWGVDTSEMSEEESGVHVVESCIDAIDQCKPYMVVLLGNRYGWIPDKSLVESLHDARFESIFEQETSITQLEIVYGALSTEDLERCIFCFRGEAFYDDIPESEKRLYNAESAEHEAKLNALKERIRSNPNAKCIEYHPVWDKELKQAGSLDAFAEQVEQALWQMIEPELAEKENLAAEERIIENALGTGRSFLTNFIARNSMSEELAMDLAGRKAFWLVGEGGSGKSAIAADHALMAKRLDYHTFLYYCGNPGCESKEALVNTLLYWLRKDSNLPTEGKETDPHDKMVAVTKLLYTPVDWDRCIVIDAVDQMKEDITEVLIALSESCQATSKKGSAHVNAILVTSLGKFWEDNKASFSNLFLRKEMRPFTLTERNSMIAKHAGARGKEVDDKVLNAISAKENAGNPFYISILLQDLFSMTKEDFEEAERLAPGMAGITALMLRKVADFPEDYGEAISYMFRENIARIVRTSASLDERVNEAYFRRILRLMAVSAEGLTLWEIEELLYLAGEPCATVFLEKLFTLLYDSFTESGDGHWNLKHRLLTEFVLSDMTEAEKKEAAKLLYTLSLEKNKFGEALYYSVLAEDQTGIQVALRMILDDREANGFLFLSGLMAEGKLKTLSEAIAAAEDQKARDAGIYYVCRMICTQIDTVLTNTAMWLTGLQTLANVTCEDKEAYFWQKAAFVNLYWRDYVDEDYDRELKALIAFLEENVNTMSGEAVWESWKILNNINLQPFRVSYREEEKIQKILLDVAARLSAMTGLAFTECVSLQYYVEAVDKKELPPEEAKSLFLFMIREQSGRIETLTSTDYEDLTPYEREELMGYLSAMDLIGFHYRKKKMYALSNICLEKIRPYLEKRVTKAPTLRERLVYDCVILYKYFIIADQYKLKYLEARLANMNAMSTQFGTSLYDAEVAFIKSEMIPLVENLLKEKGDHGDYYDNSPMVLAKESMNLYQAAKEKERTAQGKQYLQYYYMEQRLRFAKKMTQKDVHTFDDLRWSVGPAQAVELIPAIYEEEYAYGISYYRTESDKAFYNSRIIQQAIAYFRHRREMQGTLNWAQKAVDAAEILEKDEKAIRRYYALELYADAAQAAFTFGGNEEFLSIVASKMQGMLNTFPEEITSKKRYEFYRIRLIFHYAVAVYMKSTRQYDTVKQFLDQVKSMAKREGAERFKLYWLSKAGKLQTDCYLEQRKYQEANDELLHTYQDTLDKPVHTDPEDDDEATIACCEAILLLAKLGTKTTAADRIAKLLAPIVRYGTLNEDVTTRPEIHKLVEELRGAYTKLQIPEDELISQATYLLDLNEETRAARKQRVLRGKTEEAIKAYLTDLTPENEKACEEAFEAEERAVKNGDIETDDEIARRKYAFRTEAMKACTAKGDKLSYVSHATARVFYWELYPVRHRDIKPYMEQFQGELRESFDLMKTPEGREFAKTRYARCVETPHRVAHDVFKQLAEKEGAQWLDLQLAYQLEYEEVRQTCERGAKYEKEALDEMRVILQEMAKAGEPAEKWMPRLLPTLKKIIAYYKDQDMLTDTMIYDCIRELSEYQVNYPAYGAEIAEMIEELDGLRESSQGDAHAMYFMGVTARKYEDIEFPEVLRMYNEWKETSAKIML